MSTPVANARMYSATPSVRQDWRELLRWTLVGAGLPWPVIDHDPPAPLAALWARDDLGLAMMCGLPFSQRGARPTIVAAPIPSPARYGGRPIYFTDIVVAAEARHQRLEDTFGGTVGYTLADSMSGGVAFRNHLAPYRKPRSGRLYARAVGNLINARGVIEALAAGTIDVGPLDSYYHDLLRANEPALAAKARVVASTAAMPIPPLVATAPLPATQLQALRDALQRAGAADELGALRARLLLSGFAVPDASDYDALDAIARRPIPSFEDL
jgi:ABC-type phosphate/phosphonate transport system substrate-binding protein